MADPDADTEQIPRIPSPTETTLREIPLRRTAAHRTSRPSPPRRRPRRSSVVLAFGVLVACSAIGVDLALLQSGRSPVASRSPSAAPSASSSPRPAPWVPVLPTAPYRAVQPPRTRPGVLPERSSAAAVPQHTRRATRKPSHPVVRVRPSTGVSSPVLHQSPPAVIPTPTGTNKPSGPSTSPPITQSSPSISVQPSAQSDTPSVSASGGESLPSYTASLGTSHSP